MLLEFSLIAFAYLHRVLLSKIVLGWAALAFVLWLFSDRPWETEMRETIDTRAVTHFEIVPGDGFARAQVEIDNPTEFAIADTKIVCPVTGEDGISYTARAGGFNAPEVAPYSKRTFFVRFNIADFQATADRYRIEDCSIDYEPIAVEAERNRKWVSSRSG